MAKTVVLAGFKDLIGSNHINALNKVLLFTEPYIEEFFYVERALGHDWALCKIKRNPMLLSLAEF